MKKCSMTIWRRTILFGMALAAFSLVHFMSMAVVVHAEDKQKDREIPFQVLEGRWIRPDGGYILELRSIKKDGKVTAAYFNPQPIRVHRSKISRKDGIITLVVELRDINYPGSTYTLQYDAASDRLQGTYFQAVHRQTFAIEFARAG